MTKVQQTIFGNHGNCLAACIASIFEVEMSVLPTFAEMPDAWLEELNDWLRPKGLGAILIAGDDKPDGYCIRSSTRLPGRRHCCVALNGEVAWDPSPTPILTEDGHWWVIFTALDPTKLSCT